MLTIKQINTKNKSEVNRFVDLPYRLYKKHPQWVPPIRSDVALMLNKDKHPFYEHSEADFFVATRDGEEIGRLAVLENRHFNEYHHTKNAQFYLFDATNDQEAATELFARAFEWAKNRGLTDIVGPKGFGPVDGYGLLVEGFEHRQMMNMMNYNYPYYVQLVENLGFEKEVDFVSAYLNTETFAIPERIHRIAERARVRSGLEIKRFASKKELLSWAPRIGRTYNEAFVNNWEYIPLTDREIKFVVDNIMLVADYRLFKIITHDEAVVGFLFAFPDISAAMQRINGRLFPFGVIDILLEMRRTKWVSINGAGILSEFHGRGGNALLYSEMEKTIREFKFQDADLTQIAETAVEMRSDLMNLGGKAYKNHRVYTKQI
jgi:hypothetical protein